MKTNHPRLLAHIFLGICVVWVTACGSETPQPSAGTAAPLTADQAMIQFDHAEVVLAEQTGCQFEEIRFRERVARPRVELRCPDVRSSKLSRRKVLLDRLVAAADAAIATGSLGLRELDLLKIKRKLADRERQGLPDPGQQAAEAQRDYRDALAIVQSRHCNIGNDYVQCNPHSSQEALAITQDLEHLAEVCDEVRGDHPFTRGVHSEAAHMRELSHSLSDRTF